jgi:hypothetical protein
MSPEEHAATLEPMTDEEVARVVALLSLVTGNGEGGGRA